MSTKQQYPATAVDSALVKAINDGVDGQQIGEDLFGAADLLREDKKLARALTDPGRDAAARQQLATDVFKPAISTQALNLVVDLTGDHWSKVGSLADAVEELGLDSYILAYDKAADGDPATVLAQELVDASLLIAASRDLRIQLSELGQGNRADRAALARKVFHGQVSPIAERLLARAAYSSHFGRILQTVRSYAERAAIFSGGRLVVATTSEPLTDDQYLRLGRLAERRWDTKVQMVRTTDPQMLGGFRLEAGSESVDTSIRTDIAAARAALTR